MMAENTETVVSPAQEAADTPTASEEPPKKRRGRPPGSKNKRKAQPAIMGIPTTNPGSEEAPRRRGRPPGSGRAPDTAVIPISALPEPAQLPYAYVLQVVKYYTETHDILNQSDRSAA